MARTPRNPPRLFIAGRRPWTSSTRALAAKPSCTGTRNPKFPPPQLKPRHRRCLVAVSHPGSAQGGKEPSCAACCRALAPWRPSDLAEVLVPHRRVIRSLRRVAAALAASSSFAASRATRRCSPCFKSCPRARDRVRRRVLPLLASGHRRPPPLSARTRPRPPDQDPTRPAASPLADIPSRRIKIRRLPQPASLASRHSLWI
jgi:hypothetical protein